MLEKSEVQSAELSKYAAGAGGNTESEAHAALRQSQEEVRKLGAELSAAQKEASARLEWLQV